MWSRISIGSSYFGSLACHGEDDKTTVIISSTCKFYGIQ